MVEEYSVNPENVEPDGHKQGGAGLFEGAFSAMPYSSAIKEMVHPGKDVKELLMRTVLQDVNEARDLALTLSKCDEFHMQPEKELMLYLLAARTSVKGLGRDQLLQAIVGFYRQAEKRKQQKTEQKQESAV